MKILLVTGSRTIDDKDFVFRCLDETKKIFDFDTIIEGGAEGVDSFAGLYAVHNGIELITKYPQWDKYRKRAGLVRNTEMVKICTKGIGIWDGESRGTKHCIDELIKAEKLLRVFMWRE